MLDADMKQSQNMLSQVYKLNWMILSVWNFYIWFLTKARLLLRASRTKYDGHIQIHDTNSKTHKLVP